MGSGDVGWTDGVMLSRWRDEGDKAIEISRADGPNTCLGDTCRPEADRCDLLEKDDRRDRIGE